MQCRLPAALLLLCLTVPQCARADPKIEAIKAIRAACGRLDGAVSQRDLDASLADYAPDFVSVAGTDEVKGTDGPRRRLSSLFSICKSLKATTEVTDVASDDKNWASAIVGIRRRLTGVRAAVGDRSDEALSVTEACRDFWVKTGGGWKVRREKTLTSTVLVNGRAVGDGLGEATEAPTEYNLSGTWQVRSPVSGKYRVRINQSGDRLAALKITGTRFVPAGQVTWYGTYGTPGAARLQTAAGGHKASAWEAATIQIADADHFTLQNPTCGAITYQREMPSRVPLPR